MTCQSEIGTDADALKKVKRLTTFAVMNAQMYFQTLINNS
jgi:hypothetical protein